MTPDGTSSAYLWKTCRSAIPKASPRTLAVAPSERSLPSPACCGGTYPDLSGGPERLTAVNASQTQLGMRTGQIERTPDRAPRSPALFSVGLLQRPCR
jgi:hypothetical protein